MVSAWNRITIGGVEDLQHAVLGTSLDAVQLSRGPMSGSLAFAAGDDVVISTGRMSGHVSFTGTLSETMTALGLGIVLAPGSRQWMRPVETGEVGVFRAGDAHEAIYGRGSLYVCVCVHDDRLEEIAADMELVLDAKQLGGSGISRCKMAPRAFAGLHRAFHDLHGCGEGGSDDPGRLSRVLLESFVTHLSREPRRVIGSGSPSAYDSVVTRARDFIMANLSEPLAISSIARAAHASQSTLYRAFHEVLDETPQAYVRKLRLNRIRRDLASHEEAECTITLLANRWGLGELGRVSRWYRELFGELPSGTRAKLASASASARDGLRRLTRTA